MVDYTVCSWQFARMKKNSVNTGRETFMLPLDGSGKFPVFQRGLDVLKPSIPMPKGSENKMNTGDYFPNGNFTL